jgi:hypothetical protein
MEIASSIAANIPQVASAHILLAASSRANSPLVPPL